MTRARHRCGRDRGSIAPLVPIVMVAFLLLGGLVVDGSRDLNARGNAQAFAEEAARAGATAIDPAQATLQLDTTKAAQQVRGYCNAIKGTHAAVTITSCGLADPAFTAAMVCGGGTADIVVNTQVRLRIDTTLLGFVGVGSFTASAAARARPYEGITAADAC